MLKENENIKSCILVNPTTDQDRPGTERTWGVWQYSSPKQVSQTMDGEREASFCLLFPQCLADRYFNKINKNELLGK